MPNKTSTTDTLRVSSLSQRAPNRFRIAPDAEAMAALAEELDLVDLRKVVFEGTVQSEGRRDWRLEGHLVATVTQPCVATLAPVTTRIETDVTRRFLAEGIAVPEGDEVEMPDDVDQEPLTETISLGAILTEALSLSLPPYPRADTPDPVEARATPKGAEPLTDADTKPFAGLAALRDKLEGDG